ATCTIAVDSAFSLETPILNRRRGTAVLPVDVPGAGKVALSGKGVDKRSKNPAGEGTVKLIVKATGRKRQRLRRTGKAKVRARVRYSPVQGSPKNGRVTIKLVRR